MTMPAAMRPGTRDATNSAVHGAEQIVRVGDRHASLMPTLRFGCLACRTSNQTAQPIMVLACTQLLAEFWIVVHAQLAWAHAQTASPRCGNTGRQLVQGTMQDIACDVQHVRPAHVARGASMNMAK